MMIFIVLYVTSLILFCFKLSHDKQPIPGKVYYISKHKAYVRFRGKKFKSSRKYYERDEKSLGLGSQTSQLLALLTLSGVDHFIKEQLHIKYYGRYMDDLYLIHNDAGYLHYCLDEIEKKLREVGLTMNRKKSYVAKIHPIGEDKIKKNPFKYLKWDFYITNTNKIIQLPFREKVSRQRNKLRKMAVKWKQGLITTEEVQDSYRGWRAHVAKGTSFYVLQKMDNYFHSLFKGVEIK